MNLARFEDPVSHLFVAVVASLFQTQEVVGSNPFDEKFLVADFSENI